MLGICISVPIVALSGWLLWKSVTLFHRHNAGWSWWVALVVVFIAGAFGGYRLARVDLMVSPTFRWVGLPMPIGFFQLEGDRWTDFIPPVPVQLLNLLADMLIPVMILLSGLLLAWRLTRSTRPAPPGANQHLQPTPR
jgi:phosphatidylserine synthase